MKAQTSLELLLNALIVFAMISALFFVLLGFYEKAKNEQAISKETLGDESMARTMDVLASTGGYKMMETTGIYRIEGSLLIVERWGKTMVTGTIFNEHEDNGEHI